MNNEKQIKVSDLKLHSEVSRIPFGSDGEFQELKADIVQKGIENALEVNSSGVILDGRRRWTAAKELGIESVSCLEVSPEDELDFLFRRALLRRNLSDYARIELLKNHREHLAAMGRKNQSSKTLSQNSEKPIDTNRQLAEVAGISHDTVGRCIFLDKNAPEEVKQQLRAGEVSVNKAYETIRETVLDRENQTKARAAKQARPPYAVDEGDGYENKILCGDNRELLAQVPDGVASIVITSPPYPTTLVQYDVYKYDGDYSKYLEMLRQTLAQCFRILRSGGRMFLNIDNCSCNEVKSSDESENGTGKRDVLFDLKRIAYELGFLYMDTVIWGKQKTVGSKHRQAWGSYCSATCPRVRANHEYVAIFCKESRRLERDEKHNPKEDTVFAEDFIHATVSCWNYDFKNKRAAELTPGSFWYIQPAHRTPGGHPAQFPDKLVELVLSVYSRPGDLVVDPFNGGGTTTKVAQKLGRRFLGIDVSEDYCSIAQSRLAKQ